MGTSLAMRSKCRAYVSRPRPYGITHAHLPAFMNPETKPVQITLSEPMRCLASLIVKVRTFLQSGITNSSSLWCCRWKTWMSVLERGHWYERFAPFKSKGASLNCGCGRNRRSLSFELNQRQAHCVMYRGGASVRIPPCRWLCRIFFQ